MIDTALDMTAIGAAARRAAPVLAAASPETRSAALLSMAEQIAANERAILAANAQDVSAASANGATGAFMDRLRLDPARIRGMVAGVQALAQRPDPVGRVLAQWRRPNGLVIEKRAVPIGVLALIFESRPGVTADAAAIAIRSGNAAILRGGSEAFRTCAEIAKTIDAGLAGAGLPTEAVQVITSGGREAAAALITGLGGAVDLLIPRGGKSLTERVLREARVATLGHLEGLCHSFVHASADLDAAERIVLNAKMRRPGVCGATETLLIDRACAAEAAPRLGAALTAAGCAIKADQDARALIPAAEPAEDQDFRTEHLDAVINIAVVDGVKGAVAHIASYGSGHTDAILARDPLAIERFCAEVDSAIVIANASTQFADGGEFGFGAEMGIATGRLHARGPVGADELTTYKYVVVGADTIRP